jgi:hypothetical protein
MPPKHRQPNAPRPKLAGNAYKALVDLPHDRSDPFTDGRDGKVDGTDERSAANAPQHASAVGTTAAPSPQQTPNRDPLLHIWCHELITAAVNTIVHDAPLDCSPKVIYHYSAVSLCTVCRPTLKPNYTLPNAKTMLTTTSTNCSRRWTQPRPRIQHSARPTAHPGKKQHLSRLL